MVGKSDQNFNYTVLHTRGQVQKVSHSLNLMNVIAEAQSSSSVQQFLHKLKQGNFLLFLLQDLPCLEQNWGCGCQATDCRKHSA